MISSVELNILFSPFRFIFRGFNCASFGIDLFTSLMGVPERGICNDKIAEATSVKVEVLHISNSG